MIPVGQPLPVGYCQHCRIECRDCTGAEIWPDRPEFAEKIIWQCPNPDCRARVGSHESTGEPLGTAADPELRRARVLLHERLDPLWKNAHRDPAYASGPRVDDEASRIKRLAIIKRTARSRVYKWLGAQMDLSVDRCHIALFDLVDCRVAWRALQGVTYSEIREWAHAEKKKAARAKAAAEIAQAKRP